MKRFFFFVLITLSIALGAYGQEKDSLVLQQENKVITPLDLTDVIIEVFHIKTPKLDSSNKIVARKPFLVILPGIGYQLQTGFTVVVVGNISFYLSNKKDANISSISTEANYTFLHQFFVPLVSNIWVDDNAIDFQGDWRYYKYPSLTYGLGGHSSLSNAQSIDYFHLRIYQTALMQVANDFLIGPGYNLDYHWGIHDFSAEKGIITDYEKYGLTKSSVSSGISANILYDSRRNSNYPVAGGHYANIVYRPNLVLLGSEVNYQTLLVDLRKYISFPANSNNILAFWNYYWVTLKGKPPYLDLPSTGWDTYNNLGRGYIQGRLRGNNLAYFETEYRYHFTKNGLIGGVFFANIQTVSDWPGNSFRVLYPGGGAGIRLKANKNSNTNIAIDYGIGMGGSRGFFFNLGEDF